MQTMFSNYQAKTFLMMQGVVMITLFPMYQDIQATVLPLTNSFILDMRQMTRISGPVWVAISIFLGSCIIHTIHIRCGIKSIWKVRHVLYIMTTQKVETLIMTNETGIFSNFIIIQMELAPTTS